MSKKEYSVDRMIEDLTRILLAVVIAANVTFAAWFIQAL